MRSRAVIRSVAFILKQESSANRNNVQYFNKFTGHRWAAFSLMLKLMSCDLLKIILGKDPTLRWP